MLVAHQFLRSGDDRVHQALLLCWSGVQQGQRERCVGDTLRGRRWQALGGADAQARHRVLVGALVQACEAHESR